MKFLQCDDAGCWPTNLGWHQLPSSSIGDEFNKIAVHIISGSINSHTFQFLHFQDPSIQQFYILILNFIIIISMSNIY